MDINMEILLATNNKGKVAEMKAILADLNVEVYSLKDKNIDIDVVEDGTTFEENSMKKAKEICEVSGMITVADDSGLEVDFLDGAPGVYSARYAGEDATDEDRYNKLLEEMKNVPDSERSARFVSVISIAYPNGESKSLRGECEGVITREPVGSGGFGYDPVFLCTEYNKTFGELSADEKNKIRHRAVAMGKLKTYLKNK